MAVEEPLEMRVDGRPLAVTMRTPGADLALFAGFLLTEGIIEDADDLAALGPGGGPNTVDCRLAEGSQADLEALQRATREIAGTSACGICGKTRIDAVTIRARRPVTGWVPDPTVLHALPDALRSVQPGFLATGGLHGAALFDADGRLSCVQEDVGRHNAVDKVIGAALLAGTPTTGLGLVVSSRAGFEIVQKAVVAGLGAVVALGAASTLAVDLAREHDLSLFGFVSPRRATRYS